MPEQRIRILEATLTLMADHGAGGTSMRAVAAACDCNVATLYHYFPSKHDLLQAALAHRRHADLLRQPFPGGLPGTVESRLAALLVHLFTGMTDEEHFWRALLAEAMRGDDDVLGPLLETAAAFELALANWLRELCPDAPELYEPETTRALRSAVIGVLIEHLPQPVDRRSALEARARELARVFTRAMEPKEVIA